MKKISILLLIFTMVIGILSGCSSTPNKSYNETVLELDNVIVLAGNHANSVKPNYSILMESIEDVAFRYGDICAVVSDGEPYIACNISVPEQKSGLSASKRHSIANSQACQIIELLNSENCIAKTEGLDLLGSFEIASRVLNTDDYLKEKTLIYIFDTGLSTYGMDFTELDMSANSTEEIINRLKEKHLIPDLTNASIIWYGLCDVAEPQAELSSEQKDKVKEIWNEILSEAGANVQFMSDISTDKFDLELPGIKPVLSRTSAIEWNKLEGNGEDEFPEAVVFDESSIAFAAGTADLMDYNAAYDVLQHSAEYIKEHEDFSVLLVGSTACWGDLEDYCIPLATKRCETVKNILVDMGVDEKKISIIGMGYDNPFYQNDRNSDGSLNEAIAQQNRCIVLLDANEVLGRNLLEGSWEE